MRTKANCSGPGHVIVWLCWGARVRPCSSKPRRSWRVGPCPWRDDAVRPAVSIQAYWQRLCDVLLLASSAQTGPTFTRRGVCGHAGPRFRDVTRRLLQCHSRGGIQVYHRQAPASYECRCSRRHRHAEVRSRTHVPICSTTSCTGSMFPSGCSTKCVQRFIAVCSIRHHTTLKIASSLPQILPVVSTCSPPAAISCLYHDTVVPYSVVGPFLWPDRWSSWNSLPPSRSDSFC